MSMFMLNLNGNTALVTCGARTAEVLQDWFSHGRTLGYVSDLLLPEGSILGRVTFSDGTVGSVVSDSCLDDGEHTEASALWIHRHA
jgi:hypothetical protein